MGQKSDVSEAEAKAVYLALDGRRTVRRVHAAVAERFGTAPGVGTIGRWIKDNNWAEEAHQSDQAAIDLAKPVIEDRKAKVIEALSEGALKVVESIKAAVETGITPTDPQQLKVMVDAARGMLQELAVQTGGVSDRTEVVTRDDRVEVDEYDRAMRKAQLLH